MSERREARVETKFSKSPEKWSENVAIATGILRAVAANRSTTTYKQLAALIAPDVHHRHELAHILGELVTKEHEEGRPLLSSVVIRADEKKPGIGFAGIARDLGIEIPDGEEVPFWLDQLLRTWGYWSKQ